MAYRKNVKDHEQKILEIAEYENSVAINMNGSHRIHTNRLGGSEKVAHESSKRHKNAGVVMPVSDNPNVFTEDS